MWRSSVARLVRDEEVAGSNPVIPTNLILNVQCSMFNYKLRFCKKLFITIVAAVLFSNNLYSQQTDSPSTETSENIKEITILHWNDFHARNLPYRVSKKDTLTGENNYYYIGGTSNMLGYIKKLRDENTLLLNGGDDFQGTPISSISRGKSQIELLNLYDLSFSL